MQAIAEAGGEASYHYEELATEAKASCLWEVEQVQARLPLIRQRFLENLQRLRGATGLPMTTVASHGDWANRKLGLANTEILKCPEMRRSATVQVEAYDYDLLKFVTARYADAVCPVWWVGKRVAQAGPGPMEFLNGGLRTPVEAVREGLPAIYVLLHPEQWRRGPRWHFKEQVKRLREGVGFCLGMAGHSAEYSELPANQLFQESCYMRSQNEERFFDKTPRTLALLGV